MHLKLIQARYITLCQQLLALGVVVALLVPATAVLSLDVVRDGAGAQPAPRAASLMAATVPDASVEAEVTEIALTPTTEELAEAPAAAPTQPRAELPVTSGRRAAGAPAAPGANAPEAEAPAPAPVEVPAEVTSDPETVTGYGAVGITWESGQEVGEDAMTMKVRTRTGEQWSGWSELEYHDEHAPDPASPDAATARPGTEPLFVGNVDDVQVSVDGDGDQLPTGMSLAVVTPGEASGSSEETPTLAGAADGEAAAPGAATQGEGAIALSAGKRRKVAQPTIFSRAQWGADERIRNKKSLAYGTINAGFVHHTVNANNYTEAEVPGIIRSIYAYHVKSRGWSDVGYNFLVDRFGRIWEGRYGGIDKAVVGAHTLGYNQYSFAMSAIGNFDVVAPTDAMLRSYGQLFAWKLSLHGVDPNSTSQQVGKSTFAAINGHRDAGSTACPGRYLYAQMDTIRAYAAAGTTVTPPPPPVETVTVSEPNLVSNLAGSSFPDVLVRRASDARGLVIPTEGLSAFTKKRTVNARGWAKRGNVFVSADVTGDKVPDALSTDSKGVLRVRTGVANAAGTKFGKVVRSVKTTAGHTLLAAAGDLTGDGRADLVARKSGRMIVFRGTKAGGFSRAQGPKGLGGAVQLIGAGDANGDGHRDVLARTTKGGLKLYAGNGKGGFANAVSVAGSWGSWNRIVGGVDVTGDGTNDLVARRANGDVFVLPGHGNGNYGAALGPAANLKKFDALSSAGSLDADASADLVGVRGDTLVAIASRGTRDLGAPVDTGVSFAGMDLLLNAGDLNSDGHGDVLARSTDGTLNLYPGNGTGALGAPVVIGGGWNAISALRAVGDVTGDGFPDLIGSRDSATVVFRGNGASGFAEAAPVAGRLAVAGGLPADVSAYDFVFSIQSVRLKSRQDHLARDRATGVLNLFAGTTGATSKARPIGELGGYDLVG